MRLVNRGAPLRMVLPLITTSDLWEQLLNQDGDAPLLVGQRGWTLFRECILCGDQGLVFFPLKRYLQGRKLWFARQFVKERRRLSNRNAQRATRRAQRALRHQLQLDRRALLQHHAALQQELDTQRAIRQALGGLTERQSREQEEEEEEEGGATVSVPQLQAKLEQIEEEKRQAELDAATGGKVDRGWGTQIRSYVIYDNRVKDHRTGHEVGNPQTVLDGDLDGFIDSELKRRRSERD